MLRRAPPASSENMAGLTRTRLVKKSIVFRTRDVVDNWLGVFEWRSFVSLCVRQQGISWRLSFPHPKSRVDRPQRKHGGRGEGRLLKTRIKVGI